MMDADYLALIRNSTATDPQRPKAARNQSADRPENRPDDPKLRSACQGMEALFINYLLAQMRSTVDKSGFMSGGQAEEIFTSMLDTELSQEASSRGGIGLADILYNQLSRQK